MILRGLDMLRTAGRLDRTIIIVVGDHGEALGDHGEATHGLFAYNATLRVPMIVNGPGIPARVVRAPAATVDIVPTVLSLLGIPVPTALGGRSLLAADEDRAASRRPMYFEALDANLTRGWAPLAGVIVDGWKVHRSPDP